MTSKKLEICLPFSLLVAHVQNFINFRLGSVFCFLKGQSKFGSFGGGGSKPLNVMFSNWYI